MQNLLFLILVRSKGAIALKTEFLQDVEVGLGVRRGALRFEGGLKWTRTHVDDLIINDVNILDDPFEDLFIEEFFNLTFEEFENYFSRLNTLDYYLERLSRETIDALGPVGGIVYEYEDLFYVGGKIGLVRASVGNMSSGVSDWTSLYQFDS